MFQGLESDSTADEVIGSVSDNTAKLTNAVRYHLFIIFSLSEI